jgi:hypothetical protein
MVHCRWIPLPLPSPFDQWFIKIKDFRQSTRSFRTEDFRCPTGKSAQEMQLYRSPPTPLPKLSRQSWSSHLTSLQLEPELELQPETSSEVMPTQLTSFPSTPIPRANALLEGLSPLTTMSSIDTMPTFSVSGASEESETPQESAVQQVPEVRLRRSARGAFKVKTV